MIHNAGVADEVLLRLEDPPGEINDLADFFAGLLYCMREGRGAEWLIRSEGVHRYLRDKFLRRAQSRMGGNAGIMANALADIGATAVVPNVVSLSRCQQRLFSDRPSLSIPALEDGELKLKNPRRVRPGGEDLQHFIFEFERGKTVRVGDREVTSERENRFIATYDDRNLEMIIDPAFERCAETMIEEFNSALVSGFHLYTEQHQDKEGVRENIRQIRGWKERNPELFVHLELGDFYNEDLMRDILLDLAPSLDSIGMNEEELAKLAGAFNGGEEPAHSLTPLLGQAKKCYGDLGVDRLCVHTREFSITLSRAAEPEREVKSLIRGANVAAHLALKGKVVGRRFSHEGLHISEHGERQREALLESGGTRHLNGAYQRQEDHVVCVNPSRITDSPVTNVGLGDTFTAATIYELMR